MAEKRIIPCLDIKNGKVVKGTGFNNLKNIGDPVEIARLYDRDGADEIACLDICASPESRSIMTDLIKKIALSTSIPLIVGGGIACIEDIDALLYAGADKVSINSGAVRDPALVCRAAELYGSRRIVAAIDAKARAGTGRYEVYINGGRTNTGTDVAEWCRFVAALGAGEILLTSIDADGGKCGYNIPLTRQVAETVDIPVIASGGAGSREDIYEVLTEGRANAALAASLFHHGDLNIGELKAYLAAEGVCILL